MMHSHKIIFKKKKALFVKINTYKITFFIIHVWADCMLTTFFVSLSAKPDRNDHILRLYCKKTMHLDIFNS